MTSNHKGPYKSLVVWQKSMDLVVEVYRLTDLYSRVEIYGLTFQTRKSAVSIPSNIAEGKRRETDKDYMKFLNIAYASGSELETQIEIAKQLGYADVGGYERVDSLLNEVMRMLNTMTRERRVVSSG